MTVSRADYIAGLRALADLLEKIPEIPHYDHGVISFAVAGSDEDAFAAIEAAAAALEAEDIPFHRRASRGGLTVGVDLAGVRYEFCRTDERRRAEYKARCSYESSIQVDTTADTEAASKAGGAR